MAASCIIADRAEVAIRYRDAGRMWRLLRQSLRMVDRPTISLISEGRAKCVARLLDLQVPPFSSEMDGSDRTL